MSAARERALGRPVPGRAELLQRVADEIRSDRHHRARAWGHCFGTFQRSLTKTGIKNVDFMAQALAVYLAAFGMYARGSALLQRSYRTHCKAIRVLADPHFRSLNRLAPRKFRSDKGQQQLLRELWVKVNAVYEREFERLHKHPSHTMVSKVLLGTLACTIGFDTETKKGRKLEGVGRVGPSAHGVARLCGWYLADPAFAAFRRERHPEGPTYPPMRVLDLYLWYRGKTGES